MDREAARQMIRREWRALMPFITETAKRKVNGQATYVCPICQNGSGKTGDGLAWNPKSQDQAGLKCFKCGFSGDVIDLYRQAVQPDYSKALAELAGLLGEKIDPYQPGSGQRRPKPQIRPIKAKADQKATEPAKAASGQGESQEADFTAYYHKCRARLADAAAISYLTARGISPETAAAYWIGYDAHWISPTAARRAEEAGRPAPPESPRIIIPTRKSHYIARDVRPDLEGAAGRWAKMNEGSPGIFNAQALYAGSDAVFICEGAFDALSVIEVGYTAIAINSTANVQALLRLLGDRPAKVTLIIMLDNDDAGEKAAAELAAGLRNLGLAYIRAKAEAYQGEKDANAALCRDRAAFSAAVADLARRGSSAPDGMAGYIKALMADDIARFSSGIDTGFEELDRLSGGLYPGLYVLGAVSSLGKTTFALQMADQVAAAGNHVLFFSLEQSRLELATKSIARRVYQASPREQISSLAIRKGYMPSQARKAAADYAAAVGDRLSVIEGNMGLSPATIRDYIVRYIAKNGADGGSGARPVVIVDYLQILQPDISAGRQTAREMVDATVTGLKRMSRDLDITIICISSLNRQNYLTTMDFESFKESGGIEYTADVVWGLQLQCLRDEIFSREKNLKEKREAVQAAKARDPRQIELVCLKNRYGISNYACYYDYFPAVDLFREGSKRPPQSAPGCRTGAMRL